MEKKISGQLRALRFLILSALLLSFGSVRAQERNQADPSGSAAEAMPDVKALASSLRELQEQVRTLSAQVGELQKDRKLAAEETAQLRAELNATKGGFAPATARAEIASNPSSNAAIAAASAPQSSTSISVMSRGAQAQSNSAQSLEDVLRKLQDDQQVTDSKLDELSQTKVESASKYRMRLDGIVLFNLFGSNGTVDNLDFPQIAVPPYAVQTTNAFGASLRQSQIGMEVFGPDIAGARTSANVMFDFAGGFTDVPNGVNLGLMRLRTAVIRFDWEKTSIVAGQENLFFAPLTPTSLASLAVPALSYSGNLWNWTPQIRVEHRVDLSDSYALFLQGGILDSLTGSIPQPGYRYPTAGEQSGQPAYASRIALRKQFHGRDFTAGIGGYYARQDWGFARNLDSWAGTADVTIPLTDWATFSGEFYRGRAVGGIGGGIGQTILLSGDFYEPETTIRGLDSIGGWVQLKFKLNPTFEINTALGQDNPFAGELRKYPATASYYGPLQARNFTPFINFIYRLRSDVLFSVEYRRLQSYGLDANPNTANYVNVSLGYLF
jgi:regulator of replication initiation timing